MTYNRLDAALLRFHVVLGSALAAEGLKVCKRHWWHLTFLAFKCKNIEGLEHLGNERENISTHISSKHGSTFYLCALVFTSFSESHTAHSIWYSIGYANA